ncbi:unnamed protein product [Meloidogyne enterolobii]|uniref:Uncharacterized protein n=1 Tax=Meloidogyne enterolobii TaxID=390850 RepID=A0ACB1B148_MELEN
MTLFTQSGLMRNTTIPQHLILFQMLPDLKYDCVKSVIELQRNSQS